MIGVLLKRGSPLLTSKNCTCPGSVKRSEWGCFFLGACQSGTLLPGSANVLRCQVLCSARFQISFFCEEHSRASRCKFDFVLDAPMRCVPDLVNLANQASLVDLQKAELNCAKPVSACVRWSDFGAISQMCSLLMLKYFHFFCRKRSSKCLTT